MVIFLLEELLDALQLHYGELILDQLQFQLSLKSIDESMRGCIPADLFAEDRFYGGCMR